MKKTLGNQVPSQAQREKMIGILEEFQERFNKRGGDYLAPLYNEVDSTVELRINGEGPFAWVLAWVSEGGQILVWRHEWCRNNQDEDLMQRSLCSF